MSLFGVDIPPDLLYLPEWLSEDEHESVLVEVDGNAFETMLSRRVQHYGARYDYQSGEVQSVGSAPPIPTELQKIGKRLFSEGYFDRDPDQVIVNEYLWGQGIARHIDRTSFGSVVATVSLLESWPMQFFGPHDEKLEVLLEARSLAVMRGESRYLWSHGILKRKSDAIGGLRVNRTRRLSLTFRTLL